jgi:NAD(P)-dependent dehydrogenase (short-subunit alcohol dehydrogenase family)
MGLLEGKVCLVSGVGPGLGLQLVRAFVREGADLVLGARTEANLRAAASEVEAAGRRAFWRTTDITSVEQCRALADGGAEHLGRIDVLVNNAYNGAGGGVMFEDADIDSWRPLFDVNVLGTLKMTQAVIPIMKRQGSGSIVNVNSMSTKLPIATHSGPASGKAPLSAATRTLALELGPSGIRVNEVLMGWMWGAPVQEYVSATALEQGVSEDEIVAGITKDIPLGIVPTDSDCANAVVFLASDLARVVTGAGLNVNGGQFMS